MNRPTTVDGVLGIRDRLDRMLANEADMAFKRRAQAVFEFLDLVETDRVLDAGCGRGFFLNLARALVPGVDITGVELEGRLLRRARSRVPGAGVASSRVEALPFAAETFDKVIFTEVLEHIPDDRAAMAEVARVLKPGGVAALTVPHEDYPLAWDPVNKVLEAAIGAHIATGPLAGIWANHVRLYGLEALCGLIGDAGLVVEDVRFLIHHCFPFIHNLVYGIGKPLLERGLVPESLATTADRFDLGSRRASSRSPMGLALAAFNWFDALNDLDPPTPDRSFLVIAVKARKVVGAG